MNNGNCSDCGGFDVEWMCECKTHKGVEYCRGCECPLCADDYDDIDDSLEECHMNEDGYCLSAGTEHCDFDCPNGGC